MDFEQLGNTWRNRPADPAKPSTGELMSSIRARSIALDRTLKHRDRIETWAALLVFPIFAWTSVAGRFTVSRIGSGVLAAACLFIPLWLRRARRKALDPGLPLTGALAMERARVAEQVRLLKTVLWWYLLPLGAGVLLFLAGPLKSPWLIGLATLGVGAFYGWIYQLNQRAIREELVPRLDELDFALASLRNET